MARRSDSSTGNRCSRTISAEHGLSPVTATQINSSSLKRVKQSSNYRKRLKVVDDAKLTSRCLYPSKSPECSNNKFAPIANNGSFCSPSSENKSRCLPVSYNCSQQDLQTTGLLGGAPSKVSVITKSPSVKNNTGQYTLNSSNRPCQSFSHLHQNQLLQSHQDSLMNYPYLQGIPVELKENHAISPGIFSQSFARNTLHAALNPLILANQIFQGFYPRQGNQLSSTYQDHLQGIVPNHEIHRRIIPNHQSLLPDFSTNLKHFQGSGQSTPHFVQNPANVANQFSQIPNSSSVYQDHSQVPLTQEIPVSQASEANCTNHVPSSNSGTMYVPSTSVSTSNSEGQGTFPTQHLDVNQPPVDESHYQDPSMQEMIVDGSTEISCIDRSVSSEKCTENESTAIPNSQNQSIECSMARSPVDKVTTDNVLSTQDVDNVDEQSSTEISTEEGITSQSPSDLEGQSVDSITNIEDVWLDRIADLFDRMNSDFSQACILARELYESLGQSAKTFQSIASVSANLRKLKKSKAAVETQNEVTVDDQKVAEKEQVETKEKEKSDVDMAENKKEDNNEPKRSDGDNESGNNDDNANEDEDKNKSNNTDEQGDKDKDEDEDKDEEPPKKIRGCIRTFVLPPEYDPKNTKWTLKYRKPDSKLGLVELVEKSRVYINTIRLAHCKRVSKDSKTLARMLLVEIFSQSALSVCSLTGARANAFDIEGTNVRPGLDEHARMVILSFVEEHARVKGWGPFDTQSVINSIRSKIQEIRAKYGQTM